MEIATLRVGARIQFYEQLAPDGATGEYVGAAVCEDAFAAVAVPRVGELVSVVSLTGHDDRGGELMPWSGGPFLRVVAVEHYPVPVRDGEVPSWWDASYTEPGVNLVFHAEVRPGGRAAERLAGCLRERGWSVDPDLTVTASERERGYR